MPFVRFIIRFIVTMRGSQLEHGDRYDRFNSKGIQRYQNDCMETVRSAISDRNDRDRWDRKCSISALVAIAIATIAERHGSEFFWAIVAIPAIIWTPGLSDLSDVKFDGTLSTSIQRRNNVCLSRRQGDVQTTSI